MSLSKKITVAALAFIAALCVAVVIFLLPARPSSALEVVDGDYFTIEDGVFKGLNAEGIAKVGKKDSKIVLPSNVTSVASGGTSGNALFGEASQYITEIEFADATALLTIGDRSFANLTRLAAINLEDATALTAIGSGAFSGCVALEEITIPTNVTDIGLNAFSDCIGLTKINYFARSAAVETNSFAINSAEYYKPASVEVFIGSAEYQVNRIPAGMFSKVEIKDGVERVISHKGIEKITFTNVHLLDGEGDRGFGYYAFRGCTSLAKVSFTNCYIPVINEKSFEGCTSLIELEGIENVSLETIHKEAFKDCASLFRLVLGEDVKIIDEDAFVNCERLIEVVNLSTELKDKIQAGSDTYGKVALYALAVQDDAETTSISREGDWEFFVDSTNQNTVHLLGYIGSDTTITLPSTHYGYRIYQKAFYHNTWLEKIIIPDGNNIQIIKYSAFEGCTSLKSVTFPDSLIELGEKAMYGCSSLTEVIFKGSGLNVLQTATFSGCTALETITLKGVKTIEQQAFYGCSALKQVNLGAALKRIDGEAFCGCNKLAAVELPDTVQHIERNAFANCSALNAVYLPGNNGTNSIYCGENAFGDNEDLLVISKNIELYENRDTENLSAYSKNLTFKVRVKLYGYSQEDDSWIYKLYGKDSRYAQDGLKWVKSTGMPVQAGYASSVWFTSDDYNIPVDVNYFTSLLYDFNTLKSNQEDGEGYMELYARYIAKPTIVALTGVESRVYDENLTYKGIEDILLKCFKMEGGKPIFTPETDIDYFNAFDFDIPMHLFVNGEEDDIWHWNSDMNYILGAGTYTLSVMLDSNEYGTWASAFTRTFTIRPKTVYIDQIISWEAVDGDGGLDDGTLYIYGDAPYLNEDSALGQPTAVKTVKNSVIVYTGQSIEIIMSMTGDYGDIYGYSGNSGSSSGIYSASVSVMAKNNYKFDYIRKVPDENIEQQGLSFEFMDLGDTVVINKVWYIAKSEANHLVTESAAMYEIETDASGNAWTYMFATEDNLPKIPLLSKSVEQNGVTAETYQDTYAHVSFTLIFDDGNGEAEIANKVYIASEENFEKYFNTTMPAGKYRLTFYIDEIVGGDLAGKTYEFKVAKRKLEGNIDYIYKNVLTDENGSIPYKGSTTFISTDDIAILNEHVQLTPEGIWADYITDYYKDYGIYYYVVDGDKATNVKYITPETYYEYSYYEDLNEPVSVGTYTVFYKVCASNFSTEVTGAYELNIYITLYKPQLTDFEATYGGSVIDRVLMTLKGMDALNDRGLDSYEILTLREEDRNNTPGAIQDKYLYTNENGKVYDSYSNTTYNNSATRYVFIRIKTGYEKIVKWDGELLKDAETIADNFEGGIYRGQYYPAGARGFLIVTFQIYASSGNIELTPLHVNNWEYGEFNHEKNGPFWELQFGGGYSNYTFTLTSADGKHSYYFYGNDLNGDSFNSAPVGKYKLLADNNDPDYPRTSKCDVEILKASLKFADNGAPFIDSWNYGVFSSEKVTPTDYKLSGKGASIQDKIVFKYCTALAKKSYKNVAELEAAGELHDIDEMLINGELPIGSYYVIFTYEGDEHFYEWEYFLHFQVISSVSFDWEYGDYSKGLADYRSYFGEATDVQIEYRNGNTGGFGAIELLAGFDKGELAVGSYQMRVLVNNKEVYRATFNVLKADNSWQEVPSIKGWFDGGYSAKVNKPSASAKFGTVNYIVEDAAGRVYGVNDLNRLGVGSYILRVTVEGTDNYEGLEAIVHFNVTESSVGMTDIMIATIVFAVIALALAAAGIVLLILHAKKTDAEFRKSVKSELRRK